MTITERVLALAHGDERAVLFTVVEGDRAVGSKVLVLLDRGEVIGDDPLGLARSPPNCGATAASSTKD